VIGGESSGVTGQNIRVDVGIGGAIRWESIGHELPRRLPTEHQSDVGPILSPHVVLYPGMTCRLDFSSYQAVSGSSVIVFEMISLPIDNAALKPVIRDLSAARPPMIQAWIENRCPEGESDA
jgi:hypothetical protein